MYTRTKKNTLLRDVRRITHETLGESESTPTPPSRFPPVTPPSPPRIALFYLYLSSIVVIVNYNYYNKRLHEIINSDKMS